MNACAPTRSAAALAAALGALLAASQAEAHAKLVSATPAANAAGPAPKAVVLHFSEAVAPKFSGFDLTKADGGKVTVAVHVPAKDQKTVIGAVPAPLAPGLYRVSWHAVAADDGHRTTGDFNFTVQ
jgi:methionine-rich copper-binding protein CopC